MWNIPPQISPGAQEKHSPLTANMGSQTVEAYNAHRTTNIICKKTISSDRSKVSIRNERLTFSR